MDRGERDAAFNQRKERALQRTDIVALIGGALRWPRGRKRGKCPFHGSKSDSLAVYEDGQRFKCWGCDARGDAIDFVEMYYGFDFMAALERLEGDAGIDPELAEPVRRAKVERQWRGPDLVDSGIVGAHLWDKGTADLDSIRVWLRARRVPEGMLGDEWIGGLRFVPSGPIGSWKVTGLPGDVHQAPAMLGLIRGMDANRVARPIGVHATYLSPGLRAKMLYRRGNGDEVPARKMYGGSRCGFVVLGTYARDVPLYVGEGIETTLSGMAIANAPADACGLAVLSLKNLQGEPIKRRIKGGTGAWPLWNLKPDPAQPGVAFAHDGPVVGLIDADMKPLRGQKNRETDEFRGEAVIERAGGPLVWREIGTGERATICASLFSQIWRQAGARRVTTIRPAMGMDFNDAAKEMA